MKLLNGLSRRAYLFSPEAVKGVIARLNVSEARKENLVCVYASFSKLNNIPFSPPRYQRVERLPFIPQETEIDQLIAGTSRKCSGYLQLLKETGARAGEAWNLRWIDLDFEKMAVTIIPEKGSNPRQIKVSSKLFAMLNQLPRRNCPTCSALNFWACYFPPPPPPAKCAYCKTVLPADALKCAHCGAPVSV